MKKYTPKNTAEILEEQIESFKLCAKLLRDGKHDQSMRCLIFTQAVISQELANIAGNWEE